jgi:hypothetical protein
MNNIYNRWQSKNVEKYLKIFRVLLLSGPRQCGKTTLTKFLNLKQSSFRTLDRDYEKELAEEDPFTYVAPKEGISTQIIDEIQKVPKLISEIKANVDENNQAGQYLLTGSTNIHALPQVKESLAGRVIKLRLRPLTQGEILGKPPNFLQNAFTQSFSHSFTTKYDRKSIFELAFRGGFPEAIHLNTEDRKVWYEIYLKILLERDLLEIANIHKHETMSDLVHVLASWSGKFMDISAIGAGLKLYRSTLDSYLNLLEAMYIIEKVRPWIRTDYERLGKHSKLYFMDSGLMASTLNYFKTQVEIDADRAGKLIETFVFNELAAQIDASEPKYKLFHYRDYDKREIDFLIQRDDQAILGIEVKASASISRNDFKHLKWFKENIAKERPFVGIVLYAGATVGSAGEGFWALPIATLWE